MDEGLAVRAQFGTFGDGEGEGEGEGEEHVQPGLIDPSWQRIRPAMQTLVIPRWEEQHPDCALDCGGSPKFASSAIATRANVPVLDLLRQIM